MGSWQGSRVRRGGLSLVLIATLTLLVAAPAGAESQTVQGTGDIEKMRASNGQTAVAVKVFGLDEPCGGAQYLSVMVRWGKSAAYEIQGACVSGEWGSGLFYMSDRTNPESAEEVDCDGWKLTYNADKGFFKAFFPRKCISKAANKVKVSSEGHNYGTMTGGSAGPTSLLARG